MRRWLESKLSGRLAMAVNLNHHLHRQQIDHAKKREKRVTTIEKFIFAFEHVQG